MDEEEQGGIRIVDRRRFDSEGSERRDEVEPAKPLPIPESKKETPSDQGFVRDQYAPDAAGDDEAISFNALVMSLATQALMQLGEMDSPSGMEVPLDPAGAQQTIEILGMLQKKTKNNLTKEEATLLEEVLHNLRVGFVRVSQNLMAKAQKV